MRSLLTMLMVIVPMAISFSAAVADPPSGYPLDFWSMDVERQTPYSIEIVRSKTDGDLKTDEFYITSKPFADRPADKVFCSFSRYITPGVKTPVYVWCDGNVLEGAEGAARNLHCAYITVEWRNTNMPVRSKWANQNSNNLVTVKPDTKDSFEYPLLMAIRRVMDYLSEQPEIDSSKICVGGGSWGGFLSLILAGIDPRVQSVFDVFACGGDQIRHGTHSTAITNLPKDEADEWRLRYDPMTFTPYIKAPIMMYMCTNDYSFWAGDAIAQYNAIPSYKRIVMLPNADHGFGPFAYEGPSLGGGVVDGVWIAATLTNDPAYPAVTDPVEHGRMYEFSVTDPVNVTHASLFYSFGNPIWPARYWMEIKAQKSGSTWKADIPEEYAPMCGSVYASIVDEKGRAVSSRFVGRRGIDPRTTDHFQWKGGAAWDVERGLKAWRVPGPGGKRYCLDTPQVDLVGDSSLKVTPNPDGKFGVLTNSLGLTTVAASHHKGIRLVVDGMGQAGQLRVSVDRDTNSVDEHEFVTMLDYAEGSAVYDIPWSRLRTPGWPVAIFPFDDIRIEGARTSSAPLLILSISYYD